MKKIKTIGEFYAKRILSLPRKALIKRELESSSGEPIIEEGLFGWKLYYGRNVVECRSEAEARYLRAFLDTGMYEVFVPKEEEYLKNIVPELEKLKEKIEDIITFYIDGILNRNVREQVRREVYLEITKIPEAKNQSQKAAT